MALLGPGVNQCLVARLAVVIRVGHTHRGAQQSTHIQLGRCWGQGGAGLNGVSGGQWLQGRAEVAAPRQQERGTRGKQGGWQFHRSGFR